jgi:hydroxymethylglutaryl-CoA lyase
MTSQIELVEVGPRDGLQNQSTVLSPEARADLVLRLVGCGARRIEAVSFVNPRRVPQMAGAEEVMARLRDGADLASRGVGLIGLVLNSRGFERAVASGVDEVNYVLVASETFSLRNQGVRPGVTLGEIAEAAGPARAAGLTFGVTIAAAFGCPFEGEIAEAVVVDLAAQLADIGVDEIALADTIGVADPVTVGARLAAVRAAAPGVKLRCHFHNTRNTGLANAYAAWRAGVEVLDASVGGIGGCPFAPAATGNIATEDTVYMLHRMGVQTGYELDALIETAAFVAVQLGEPSLPAMLGRAGPFPKPATI